MATKKKRPPRITGIIRRQGRTYREGQEAELAKVLTPELVAHYRALGVIAGDWEVAEAAQETETASAKEAGADKARKNRA